MEKQKKHKKKSINILDSPWHLTQTFGKKDGRWKCKAGQESPPKDGRRLLEVMRQLESRANAHHGQWVNARNTPYRFGVVMERTDKKAFEKDRFMHYYSSLPAPILSLLYLLVYMSFTISALLVLEDQKLTAFISLLPD